MTDKIRIGLIGTGRIGQVHAASIASSKDFELTYTADPFIAGAEKVAAEYGGKVTNDAEVLLTSGEVDAILVASPTPTHVGLIGRAIELGLHVLCEKPIALDLTSVDALRETAANAKTVVALGFQRRVDPHLGEIANRVARGEIGKLEQITMVSRDPAPAPRDYIAVSGGIFKDMTIHDFDMARFFVPNIVEVTAVASNVFCDYIKEENDYDSATVVLKGAGGEIITIINCRHAAYGYDQRIEAFGSEGMLVGSNTPANTIRSYTAKSVEAGDPYPNFFLERYMPAYRLELDAFAAGIRSGKPTTPTYEDGRAALILAEAALESVKTGKTVKVSL